MDKRDIEGWRKRIDEVDDKLVHLLNERTRCAIEIGKVKAKLKIEVYDPRREEEVLRRVRSQTAGPLSEDAIRRLFERIIDETRRTEREHRQRLESPECASTDPEAEEEESIERGQSWSSS